MDLLSICSHLQILCIRTGMKLDLSISRNARGDKSVSPADPEMRAQVAYGVSKLPFWACRRAEAHHWLRPGLEPTLVDQPPVPLATHLTPFI